MALYNYTTLEPTPSGNNTQSLEGGFDTVISSVATTMIVTSLLFVFYRFFMGLVYSSGGGGPSKKMEGKKNFNMFMMGLLFTLLFTPILFYLNGSIGNLSFRKISTDTTTGFPQVASSGALSTPPSTTTNPDNPFIPKNNDDPTGWAAIQNDSAVRTALRNLPNGGITVNKSVCITPTQTGCTTVGGWPNSTLTMLASLRNTCPGNIVITGGTEAGHLSHGPGKTPVDISLTDSQLEKCIRSFTPSTPISWCKKNYTNFGFTFCDENLGITHWHVYQ